MLSTMFKKAILYVKEVQDLGLFAAMANSQIYQLLIASSLYFVMLPFLGLLMTVLTLIDAYRLAKASNQNFDKWSSFIISSICTVCASVSLYGTAASLIWGFSFAAGPWLFLSSLLVGLSQQLFMLGLSVYRAYESARDPVQRLHYIQAVWQHAFITGLVIAITGAVVFLLLTPAAPLIGSISACTAIALTGMNMLWRVIPYHWKQAIKGQLNLGKPQVTEQPLVIDNLQLDDHLNVDANKENASHQRMFSHCDYSAEVRIRDLVSAQHYLREIIVHKIERLNLAVLNEKNGHKKSSLSDILWLLDEHDPISKNVLLKQYPQAFQSFWAEKGDVEQIVDAVLIFQDRYREQIILESEMAAIPDVPPNLSL